MRKEVSKMKENKEKNEVNLVLFEDMVKKFAEDYKVTEAKLLDAAYNNAHFTKEMLQGDVKTGLTSVVILLKSMLQCNYIDNCLGIENTKLIEMISEVLNSSEPIHTRCNKIKHNSSLIKLTN